MILIFSTKGIDSATNSVIEWLKYYNAKYVLVNDLIHDIDFELSLVKNNQNLKIWHKNEIKKITAIWYRRFDLKIFHNKLSDYYNEIITNEYTTAFANFIAFFPKKNWLNHPFDCDNKIQQLIIASKVGLDIPYTLFTNSKTILKSFSKNYKNSIVSKAYNTIFIKDKNINYSNFTTEIDINKIPCKFNPGVFQQRIKKKFDLRVFVINNDCYTSAIIPTTINTDVDHRRHIDDNNMRIIPFTINTNIKNKILRFMKEIDINSGSIDMIIDIHNNYYFCELNPIGQFKNFSDICNYNLEQKIALFLIKLSKNG